MNIKTVKGYYWYSKLAVSFGCQVFDTPNGKKYTYVSTDTEGASYHWPDKTVIEVGPLTTDIWEGRTHEEWK